MPSDPVRYPARSIRIHWLMVAILALTVPLGVSLSRAPEGWGDTLYRLHWSFGMLALFVALARLANRLTLGAPPPAASLTPLERQLSGAVHIALYGLMLLVPLLGWLGKSAYGGAITIFGLFDMPALVAENEERAKLYLGLHKIAVFAFMGCIALHVAGALNHLLIKRDGVMQRMLMRRD